MLRVSEVRYRSHLRQPRHAHAETTVTIVLAGSLRERVGSAEEVARALSIVVKPRDTEHANEFADDVRTLQIVVPAATVPQIEAWERSLAEWRWQHAGPAVPAFMRLLREVRAGAAPTDVDLAAYDALGALRAYDGDVHGDAPRWLAVIREMLDDDHRAPRVADLARDAGVHPVYLARQFRRWYGCSITEHLKRRRVQRAAQAVAASREGLSLIAHQSGFADQPHMCRTFAREVGVTPSAYRSLTV
jgi:AraC family transcriptional regulator